MDGIFTVTFLSFPLDVLTTPSIAILPDSTSVLLLDLLPRPPFLPLPVDVVVVVLGLAECFNSDGRICVDEVVVVVMNDNGGLLENDIEGVSMGTRVSGDLEGGGACTGGAAGDEVGVVPLQS